MALALTSFSVNHMECVVGVEIARTTHERLPLEEVLEAVLMTMRVVDRNDNILPLRTPAICSQFIHAITSVDQPFLTKRIHGVSGSRSGVNTRVSSVLTHLLDVRLLIVGEGMGILGEQSLLIRLVVLPRTLARGPSTHLNNIAFVRVDVPVHNAHTSLIYSVPEAYARTCSFVKVLSKNALTKDINFIDFY